jgi:hypothetical protein
MHNAVGQCLSSPWRICGGHGSLSGGEITDYAARLERFPPLDWAGFTHHNLLVLCGSGRLQTMLCPTQQSPLELGTSQHVSKITLMLVLLERGRHDRTAWTQRVRVSLKHWGRGVVLCGEA